MITTVAINIDVDIAIDIAIYRYSIMVLKC